MVAQRLHRQCQGSLIALCLLASIFHTVQASVDILVPIDGVMTQVEILEKTLPYSPFFGIRSNKTWTPTRISLPVTFVDDQVMADICDTFANGSVPDFSGQLLYVDDNVDYMCSGVWGTYANYKHIQNWCLMNGTIVFSGDSNLAFLAQPGDFFESILEGDAGSAVKTCFWIFGYNTYTSQASQALQLTQNASGTYLANITMDWSRQMDTIEPFAMVVILPILGVMFLYISGHGVEVLLHRIRDSQQLLIEHVLILVINIVVLFTIGIIRFVTPFRTLSMGLYLFTYQDFYLLGTSTSFLLATIYMNAVNQLQNMHSRNPKRRRIIGFLCFVLVICELVSDIGYTRMNTGSTNIIISLIALLMIALQIIAIVVLWVKTIQTANLLKHMQISTHNRSGKIMQRLELHLRLWVRISVVAATMATLILIMVMLGFYSSDYHALRTVFDVGRAIGALAEIQACRSLRERKSKRHRDIIETLKNSSTASHVHPTTSQSMSSALHAPIK